MDRVKRPEALGGQRRRGLQERSADVDENESIEDFARTCLSLDRRVCDVDRSSNLDDGEPARGKLLRR